MGVRDRGHEDRCGALLIPHAAEGTDRLGDDLGLRVVRLTVVGDAGRGAAAVAFGALHEERVGAAVPINYRVTDEQYEGRLSFFDDRCIVPPSSTHHERDPPGSSPSRSTTSRACST
ncbi:hypothetical protein ACWCQQ_47340 [Streptomyces sp. NPDC002143]